MSLENFNMAEQTMQNIWNKRNIMGLESVIEEMESHIKKVLTNQKLDKTRFDIAAVCYSKILEIFPHHKNALDYIRSYIE